MKASEYRDQSTEELELAHEELRKEIFLMTNDMKQTKKRDDVHAVRTKKKDVARVLTVLREKEIAGIS